MSSSSSPSSSSLKELWEAAGQGQVFACWEQLSEEQRAELLDHLERVGNPEILNQAFASVHREAAADDGDESKDNHSDGGEKAAVAEIRPFRNFELLSQAPAEQARAWYDRGLEAIAGGRVAVVTLAGGQGTRLGSADPKGCYDIQLPSRKSLFQLQAERLRAVRALAGGERVPAIPWLVLTSSATDAATREFFRAQDYFGLGQAGVRFFRQADMPAFSQDGKVLLESPGSLALSPNGNGGVYEALAASGSLDYLEQAGVAWVHTIGIDNVLVRPADPSLVGFAESRPRSRIVNKVIQKTDPKEQVGVMCLRGGEPGVVEYSEIPPEMSAREDPETGLLEFGAANIAEHLFRLDFLREVAAGAEQSTASLLWHKAVKKVPFYSPAEDKTVQPAAPNAVKLERFIFDVFRLDPALAALVVPREQQFSPVKNAEGEASPATARRDLSRLHRSWVLQAAPDVRFAAAADEAEDGADVGLCEVAPAVALSLDHPREVAALQAALRAKGYPEKPLELPLLLD